MVKITFSIEPNLLETDYILEARDDDKVESVFVTIENTALVSYVDPENIHNKVFETCLEALRAKGVRI